MPFLYAHFIRGLIIYSFFGPQNRLVTLKLLRYSLLMVLIPLATFYFLFYLVFKQDKDKLGWCGIAAVLAVNIVIFTYVRMAWNEDKGIAKEKKDDEYRTS